MQRVPTHVDKRLHPITPVGERLDLICQCRIITLHVGSIGDHGRYDKTAVTNGGFMRRAY